MKKSILKKSIIIILLCTYNFGFSQEKIVAGIVLDRLKNPIQYVNVGVLNKPVGTVTNEMGQFVLNFDNSMLLDTLRISCIGFKSKDFAIKELPGNKSDFTVTLENFTEKLDEIIITSNRLKTYTKGKEKTKTKNEVFFAIPDWEDLNLGSEIGRKFSVGTKKPSLLEEFKFFIKKNNFETLKFRINIYSIKDEKPHKKINDTNIFVEVNNKLTGWIKIDLSDYKIKTQQDIIITTEWVEGSTGNELSLPILLPSINSIHYYKYGTHAKWKKYKMISSSMVLTYRQ